MDVVLEMEKRCGCASGLVLGSEGEWLLLWSLPGPGRSGGGGGSL
jgi:hypothetical protein